MELTLEPKKQISRTAMLNCKYCGEFGIVGLEIHSEGEIMRVCWNKTCQDKHKIDQHAREDFQRINLQSQKKCYFDRGDLGYCKQPVVTGMSLCAIHLALKCHHCGAQAIKECKVLVHNKMCLEPCCFIHSHVHSKVEEES
jgi:hypothetical protein